MRALVDGGRDALVEHGEQQFGLAVGVAEHRARGDVGALGDLLSGDAGVAVLVE